MRVIAGKLGGQNFEAPKGHTTHPMSDKARGGLFSTLGDIEGLSVLDAFSGSGALAIEAISRGAKSVVAIDNDRTAHQTIQQNIKKLRLKSSIKATRANVSSWSDNNPDAKFGLVFCDPPYDHLKIELIQKLARHLNTSGILILSWPGNLKILELVGFEKIKHNNYGDAQLVFYRKIG
jgi:16S rRNA (guanine966-N2)-methyltransferase